MNNKNQKYNKNLLRAFENMCFKPTIGTITFLIQTTMYVGIVIYAPALALETVTGLDRWTAVWVTGAVCIFYTSIGGLKKGVLLCKKF